jgi:hypothetical protein
MPEHPAPTSDALPWLDATALRAAVGPGGGCAHCASLVCPGWESVPGPVQAPRLEPVGTLRDPAEDEPTLAEHHPDGTHYWDALAPVATAFFPYNRCEVWRCPQCRRGFLQYLEAGGYYTDHRLRQIDPSLIV